MALGAARIPQSAQGLLLNTEHSCATKDRFSSLLKMRSFRYSPLQAGLLRLWRQLMSFIKGTDISKLKRLRRM